MYTCIECEDDEEFEDVDEDKAEADMELDESETQQEVVVTPSGDIYYDQLRSLIGEHGADTIFPPLDGTSFYRGICKINHSCIPNVLVTYQSSPLQPGVMGLTSGLVAAVRVVRPIVPGEELVQAYVDTELGMFFSTSFFIFGVYIITCL